MTLCFEKTHIQLPHTFDHLAMGEDWKNILEKLEIPEELIAYCVDHPEERAEVSEQYFTEAMNECLAWLPQDVPETVRLACEAVLLGTAEHHIYNKNRGRDTCNRQAAYLGVSTQHRITRILPHLNAEDHRHLFYDAPLWCKNGMLHLHKWKSHFTGALSVVRVIKAITLTGKLCTVFMPNLFENIFGRMDLCIELPLGGLYMDIMTVNEPLNGFGINWVEIKKSGDPKHRLEFNAALSNERYDQLWFPIKISTGYQVEAPYDSSVTEKQVRMMRRILSQTPIRFLERLASGKEIPPLHETRK